MYVVNKNKTARNKEKFNHGITKVRLSKSERIDKEELRKTKNDPHTRGDIDSKHEILNQYNEDITINGDRNLLKEALRVFIDNSIKYTEDGGVIKINSFSKNKSLILEIEDSGSGILKEDLPHIFDRFYRADKSRTKETGGTGLGLSIAKWIILNHKGTIEVQSKLGWGTKISILLPLKERV